MKQGRRVLVTGGAGYIGSNLVPALLEKGFDVVVLDNFRWRINSLASCCKYENFTVIQGDVRDESLLKNVIKKVDVIIPLAALVGAPLCQKDPKTATSVNRDAVLSLVELSDKDQMILYPNTNSGYGSTASDSFCTEETPMHPISLYGRTKCEAEDSIMSRGNAVSFRLATVFGVAPRMRIDLLVNDFVYRAFHDRFIVLFESHFKRNFIHNQDVSKAFIHALTHFESMKNQVYNLGLSGANLSKYELCEKIKKFIPSLVFFESKVGEDPDKRNYIVSNEKLEKTGWTAGWDLDQGIQELIKQYEMLDHSLFSNV